MILKRVRILIFPKFLIVVLLSGIVSNCSFFAINKEVILTVTTNASESSFPRGEILDIRLYSNNEVEFDFYLPHTPERVFMKFSSEKKKGKLNEEDFDKIKSLLIEPDLVNAQTYYAPLRKSSIDSFVKKTVIFKVNNQEKIIVLEERDSHLNLEEKLNIYPESLIKLLEEVEDVNKKLRQQIDPESR